MWKSGTLVTLAVTAAVVLAAFAFVIFDGRGDARRRVTSVRTELRAKARGSSGSVSSERIHARSETPRLPLPASSVRSSGKVDFARQMAEEKSDEEEVRLMSEVVSGLLTELGTAVRNKDLKTFRSLVGKLRSLDCGSLSGNRLYGGLVSVKRKILEAAAELGPEAVGGVLDLAGDSDESIAALAKDLMFKTLRDASVGDFQRAEIITEAAKVLTDFDDLTRVLQQASIRLRNSLRVETAQAIEKTGTAEAKDMLPWLISSMAGDPTVTTTSTLSEWLQDNPDEEVWRYEGIRLRSQDNAK